MPAFVRRSMPNIALEAFSASSELNNVIASEHGSVLRRIGKEHSPLLFTRKHVVMTVVVGGELGPTNDPLAHVDQTDGAVPFQGGRVRNRLAGATACVGVGAAGMRVLWWCRLLGRRLLGRCVTGAATRLCQGIRTTEHKEGYQ